MTKRRITILLLIIAFAITALAGCAANPTTPASNQSADKPKITLWTTGSQNLSDLFTKAIEVYNSRPESTSVVELQFIMSGSGDTSLSARMGAAKQAGKTDSGFDLIAENSTSLQGYVDAAGGDLFVDLDFSKIPNFKDVLIKSSFFTNQVVPYRGTTVVMAYDSARVQNPPKTWEELTQWIKDNPGKFAYNVPSTGGAGGGFVTTAIYKDLPVEAKTSQDAKWKAEWEAGFQWLEEIHPHLYQSGGSVVYPNKNQGTLDLLINKEVDIIPAWADQVLTNLATGTLPDTVKIYQMEPSLNGTDVVFAVPNIGKGAEPCYDFINFMISPEGQKLCLETIYAVPVIDSSRIDSDAKASVADIDVSNFSVISLGTFGTEINELWDSRIATMK